MDFRRLQDRLYWGLNRAANVLGQTADAYRPTGVSDPIDRSNRFLRLPAAFSRADGNFAQPVGYGTALYRGYFDASYTRVGDYILQNNAIWFIAEQQYMMPILCVRTNRMISVTRQPSQNTRTSNDPAGVNSMVNIISHWPASILGVGTEGRPLAQLPGDTRIPGWTALLPSVHDQILQPTDMISDERGTNGTIVAAELSNLGWRLTVRQVTT